MRKEKNTKNHWKNLRISGTSNKKTQRLGMVRGYWGIPASSGRPFSMAKSPVCCMKPSVWLKGYEANQKSLHSRIGESHLLKSGAGAIRFNWVQLMKQSLTHFVLLHHIFTCLKGEGWEPWEGSPHLRHGGFKSCLCRGSSPMMWWKMRINRHVVPNTLNPMVSRPSPRALKTLNPPPGPEKCTVQ